MSDSELIFTTCRIDKKGSTRLVGGFADRLKGICFSFALSRITERLFFIDWESPTPLSEIFTPSSYNWVRSDQQPLNSRITLDYIDSNFPAELKETIKNEHTEINRRFFHSEKVIYINCNSLNFDLFRNHQETLRRHDIDTTSAQAFFSSVFNELFSCDRIFELKGYKSYLEFKQSHQTMIGAQFRTGGEGDWNDPMLDSIENSEVFAEAILKFASATLSAQPGVFLTSDNQAAKERILSHLKNKISVFCFETRPIHFERSELSQASNGALQVALEHTILSECDHVIVGAAQFGVTAAHRGNKAPIFYKNLP